MYAYHCKYLNDKCMLSFFEYFPHAILSTLYVFFSLSSKQPCKEGTIFIPISQMKVRGTQRCLTSS